MKKLLITILTLSFCLSIIANKSYQSERITKIAKSLKYEIADTNGILITLSDLVPELSIKGIIKDNKLEHLGILLFNDLDSVVLTERKDSILLREDILLFCEREFLDLYLAKSNKIVKQKLITDRVNILYNGDDYVHGPLWDIKEGIKSLKDYRNIDIRLDSTQYQINFKGEKNTITIEFPANIQVIQGMDKRELDENFFNVLCEDTTQSLKELYPIEKGMKLEYYGGCFFLLKGNKFIITAVNSNRFYVMKDSKLSLAYDEEYTPESIRNLFYQDNERTRNIQLHLGQRLYNGKFKHHTLSLGAFVKASAKKYNTYIGVEETSDSLTTITVNLHDPNMNIFHVFEVRTSRELLFESGIMAAKGRTYIPTDNLKTLYLEDLNDKKQNNRILNTKGLPQYTKFLNE